MDSFCVGDMFYFAPHRAWGIVTMTHDNNAGFSQFIDYVLMSPTHGDPTGTVRMTNKSDSASKFQNAIAQHKLLYYPAPKKDNANE